MVLFFIIPIIHYLLAYWLVLLALKWNDVKGLDKAILEKSFKNFILGY